MDIEEQRKAYDRRQRAWVYVVIGVLVAWISATGWTSDAVVWNVVGYVGFLAGVAAVVFGVILFQRPRP